MHALGVLVELSSAGAASHRCDFGHVHEKPLGNEPQPVGFSQRDARIVLQADIERALDEWRQKRAGEQCRGAGGRRDCNNGACKDRPTVVDRPNKQRPIGALEVPQQETVML